MPYSHLYESFHNITKKHKKLLQKNDYTYGPLLKIINKYAQESQTVLDIGCGAGAVDLFLASKGKHVTGIDISRRAIDSCCSNAKKFDLEKNTTFHNIPIERFRSKQKFDLILCIEIIEHVRNDQMFLKRIASFLKKDGVLILTTPSKNAPLHRIGFLKQFDKRVGHLRRYSMEELYVIFKKSNLTVVNSHKTEGIVRNMMFTSTLGTKIMLRLINRLGIAQKLAVSLDQVLLPILGESDLVIVGGH